MKIRAVFPTLLTAQSTLLFSTVWNELSTIQSAYHHLFIDDERQGRLEDADGLPYTLDFLVLEELDFMQALLRAPPVKAELQNQLQAAGNAATTSGWLPEVIKLVVSYAQITTEEEGLWDIDVNLFLSEETSVTANYTPRTCGGDLIIKLGEWLKETTVDSLLAYINVLFSDPTSSYALFSLFSLSPLQIHSLIHTQTHDLRIFLRSFWLIFCSHLAGNTVKPPHMYSINCFVTLTT